MCSDIQGVVLIDYDLGGESEKLGFRLKHLVEFFSAGPVAKVHVSLQYGFHWSTKF